MLVLAMEFSRAAIGAEVDRCAHMLRREHRSLETEQRCPTLLPLPVEREVRDPLRGPSTCYRRGGLAPISQ